MCVYRYMKIVLMIILIIDMDSLQISLVLCQVHFSLILPTFQSSKCKLKLSCGIYLYLSSPSFCARVSVLGACVVHEFVDC